MEYKVSNIYVAVKNEMPLTMASKQNELVILPTLPPCGPLRIATVTPGCRAPAPASPPKVSYARDDGAAAAAAAAALASRAFAADACKADALL